MKNIIICIGFDQQILHSLDRASSYILTIKPTRCTNFLNLCFGIELYMFRTVFLSIIKSLVLYDIHHCRVYSTRLLMMDKKTCPNHVQFYSKKINFRN